MNKLIYIIIIILSVSVNAEYISGAEGTKYISGEKISLVNLTNCQNVVYVKVENTENVLDYTIENCNKDSNKLFWECTCGEIVLIPNMTAVNEYDVTVQYFVGQEMINDKRVLNFNNIKVVKEIIPERTLSDEFDSFLSQGGNKVMIGIILVIIVLVGIGSVIAIIKLFKTDDNDILDMMGDINNNIKPTIEEDTNKLHHQAERLRKILEKNKEL